RKRRLAGIRLRRPLPRGGRARFRLAREKTAAPFVDRREARAAEAARAGDAMDDARLARVPRHLREHLRRALWNRPHDAVDVEKLLPVAARALAAALRELAQPRVVLFDDERRAAAAKARVVREEDRREYVMSLRANEALLARELGANGEAHE